MYRRARSSKWDKGPEEGNSSPLNHVSGAVKRSRFDQGPPVVSSCNGSKWDVLPSQTVNVNSPNIAAAVSVSSCNGNTAHGGLSAAAEAAARVNAILLAKGVVKQSQPLLVNETVLKTKTAVLSAAGGAITSEVDINDVQLACRNVLTRGTTQEDISRTSGAFVSTRGRYMTDEEKKAAQSDSDKPLHLFIQAVTQESVDKAVARINEIISQHKQSATAVTAAPAVTPVPAYRPAIPPSLMLNATPTGMAYVQEKLFIGLDHADPNFNVKNRVMGPNGMYLVHIQNETGAKVILRGKGSEFMEPTSGREAFEPMYIYIQHPTPLGLQAAKKLALNLIETVQSEYSQFQQSQAALPPTISPGTATLLAGLQQQGHASYQACGMNQFSSTYVAPYQPMIPPIPPAPGLMSSGLHVLPSSVTTSVVPPGNADYSYQSTYTSLPPPLRQQFPHPGPSIMPPLPAIRSVHPNLPSVHSQPPPPFLPPTQLPIPVALPSVLPPSVQLPPVVGVPPVSSCGPVTSSVTPSSASSQSTVTTSQSSAKRKFTEEKEEERIDDNLLGYQHGPLHLKTTLQSTTTSSSATGTKSSAASDEVYDPTACLDDDYDDDAVSSNKSSHNTADDGNRTADEREQTTEKDFMPPPTTTMCRPPTSKEKKDVFTAPVLPAVRPTKTASTTRDKKLETVVEKEPAESEKKKLKGALASVFMSYTSDDDNSDTE